MSIGHRDKRKCVRAGTIVLECGVNFLVAMDVYF